MANLLCKGYLDASWTRYGLSYGKRWLINMGIRSISSSSYCYQRHAIFKSLIHAKHGCHKNNNVIQFNQQNQRFLVNKPWSNQDADPTDDSKIITVDLMGLTRPIKTAVIFFLLSRVLGDDFSKDSFLIGAKQAMKMIADSISDNDFSSLEHLLSPQAITSVQQYKNTLNHYGWDIRSILNYNGQPLTQISRAIPSQVVIVYDSQSEGGRKYVYIFVRYLYLDLSSIQPETLSWKLFSEDGRQSLRHDMKFIVTVVSYKREFTTGVQPDWTISNFNCIYPSIQDQ